MVGLLGWYPAAASADAATEVLDERVMGSEDAPVTMIEYSSLTCSHCADFHGGTFKKIKEAYIDTGKVRFVFRDFPFEQRGMTAGMVARCAPKQSFFGFLEVLFRAQDKWVNDPHFLDALRRYGRLGGISKAAFDACLENQQLLDRIVERRREADEKYKIDATPSFIIEGEKVTGNLPFADFQKIIDAKLAEK